MKVGTIFPYGQCLYFGKMVRWTFKRKKVWFPDGKRVSWECRLPREIAGYDDSPFEALIYMKTTAQNFTNRFNSGATVSLHIEKMVVLCECWAE